MAKNQRHHPAASKCLIELNALNGSQTMSQLSSDHEIHATQIQPKISTTPEAAQSTAAPFTACLLTPKIQVSIDSRIRLDAPHFSCFVVQTLGPTR